MLMMVYFYTTQVLLDNNLHGQFFYCCLILSDLVNINLIKEVLLSSSRWFLLTPMLLLTVYTVIKAVLAQLAELII